MQLGEDWEHTNKIWINIKECASQKEKKKGYVICQTDETIKDCPRQYDKL